LRTGDQHYQSDPVGAARQLPGAGILAWLTGDQLHPPMLDDDRMWRDGDSWAEGARRYVLDLGHAASLAPGEHVLDIGCGLSGPARVLVREFGVRVTGITNSRAHLEQSRRLNAEAGLDGAIGAHWVGGPDDWPGGGPRCGLEPEHALPGSTTTRSCTPGWPACRAPAAGSCSTTGWPPTL